MRKVIYDIDFAKAWKWLFFDNEKDALQDFKMRYTLTTDYIEYTVKKGKFKRQNIEMTSSCFRNWAIERGALMIDR